MSDIYAPDVPDACWIWKGLCTERGYGVFRTSIEPRSMLAHRVAFVTEKGCSLQGLTIDHLCRVRRCVNPDHLEPVVHAENSRRRSDWSQPGSEYRRRFCGGEPEAAYIQEVLARQAWHALDTRLGKKYTITQAFRHYITRSPFESKLGLTGTINFGLAELDRSYGALRKMWPEVESYLRRCLTVVEGLPRFEPPLSIFWDLRWRKKEGLVVPIKTKPKNPPIFVGTRSFRNRSELRRVVQTMLIRLTHLAPTCRI